MKGKIIRIICMQIILAMLVLSIGCGGKSFVGNEVTSESRETISTELKVPIQVLKITLSALER